MNIEIKRAKLIKFLIKEGPGLLPLIGSVWKDMVEEFTESDVDQALARIEDFQKKDHEAAENAIRNSVTKK